MKQITVTQFSQQYPEFNRRVLQRVIGRYLAGESNITLLQRYAIKDVTVFGKTFILTMDEDRKPNVDDKPYKLMAGDRIISYKRGWGDIYSIERVQGKYAYCGHLKFLRLMAADGKLIQKEPKRGSEAYYLLTNRIENRIKK